MKRPLGARAPILAVEQRREQLQVVGGHRAARQLGTVVVVLHSHLDGRIAGRAAEEAAVFEIVEALEHRGREHARPIEPAGVERGAIEVQQAERHVCIVVELALSGRLAVAPAAVERSGARVAQPFPNELRRLGRALRVLAARDRVVAENARRASVRGDHEPVPCHDHLVVPVRADAPAASREQLGPGRLESRAGLGLRELRRRRHLGDGPRAVEHVDALPVPVRRHAIAGGEEARIRRAEDRLDLRL